MQRMPRSLIKNVKERKECHIILLRTQKNARTLHSFEKNACPTLHLYTYYTVPQDQYSNHRFYLRHIKYILFGGENTAGTDDIKMRQAIQNKSSVCRLGRNRFCTQAREKGG